jgi:hypothetical protein
MRISQSTHTTEPCIVVIYNQRLLPQKTPGHQHFASFHISIILIARIVRPDSEEERLGFLQRCHERVVPEAGNKLKDVMEVMRRNDNFHARYVATI